MTPMQEIFVRVANSDMADLSLLAVEDGFQVNIDYHVSSGHPFEPTLGPIYSKPLVAFEWALAVTEGIAKVRSSTISVIENPNNTEFLNATDQKAALQRKGIKVDVLVNGDVV